MLLVQLNKNGGFYMKMKLVIIIGLTGVLALTSGFAKDLQSTKGSAEEQQ